jgi:hypothetical protein
MPKSILILVGFLVFFHGHLALAEVQTKGERTASAPAAKQKAYPGNVEGSVGRFQAVRMDDSAVVILDTKQAHLWVFGATGSGFYLVYGGRIHPGEKAGEIIDSSSLRFRKGQFFDGGGKAE